MAKLKSGTRIYGTSIIDTSVVVGSAVTVNSSGIQVTGITTSSRLTLNGANSTSDNGGQIFLNGATGNRIDFNINGIAPPSFTTRSAGTKIVLYPNISGSTVDHAFGVDTSTSWYSVPTTTAQHRFYAGTTQLADLKGSGELVIGSTSLTGTANQKLQVTGGAYVSANVGIGTTNPQYIFTVTDTGTPATTGLTNCLADFTTTANSYGQINLRNTSTGTNASSDIVITANNGTDSSNFIDLGINNSGYSVGSWTINGPTDGYLYSSDTNLSIGVAAANKYLSFFTGGTLISNERMRVNAAGVGIGTTNPGSTLDVRATGATIRVQNPAAANYGVLLDANANGPRISFGQNADNSFMEFGAYNSINNLDTKNRDLKIFSTSAPNAFYLQASTGNIGINSTSPTATLTVQGNSIFTGILTARNSVTQDSISLNGRAGGTSSFNLSLTPTTLTASRTVTFQNVTGTVYVSTGTDVTLADGGTNASLTASNGGIVYSTASAMAITSAGTSGQVLTSNGAAAPTWQNAAVSGIGIRTEGSIVGTGITLIDFRGPGVSTITAPVAGIATVNITGGGGGGTSTTRTVTRSVATEGQTSFSVTYTVGYIDVFLNGSKLDSTEYTASNGTSVVLVDGASVNDVLEFISYSGISLSGTTTIVDDNTLNSTLNVTLTNATSGSISSLRTASSELTFNPATNTFSTGNIVATGINTLTTLNSTNATITNINSSGISTLTTLNSTNATITNINSSGISTLTTLNSTNATITNINSSGISTFGTLIPTETRVQNVAEKLTRVDGNTVSIAYTGGGGNIGFAINPSGDITLNVNGIPTDSSFDNYSITFSVIVNQTGTARSCTAVNLNGVSRTIRWSGGSLANAISGVTTTNGYDIYNFTAINTVGSASTTENYQVLGVVNGGFK